MFKHLQRCLTLQPGGGVEGGLCCFWRFRFCCQLCARESVQGGRPADARQRHAGLRGAQLCVPPLRPAVVGGGVIHGPLRRQIHLPNFPFFAWVQNRGSVRGHTPPIGGPLDAGGQPGPRGSLTALKAAAEVAGAAEAPDDAGPGVSCLRRRDLRVFMAAPVLLGGPRALPTAQNLPIVRGATRSAERTDPAGPTCHLGRGSGVAIWAPPSANHRAAFAKAWLASTNRIPGRGRDFPFKLHNTPFLCLLEQSCWELVHWRERSAYR